ncbi:hypothetical protein N7504_004242 [Penicillium tannophilum]|nr:hypothetical protein N7504_004242 [Penicillium tannophilum]
MKARRNKDGSADQAIAWRDSLMIFDIEETPATAFGQNLFSFSLNTPSVGAEYLNKELARL